MAITKALADTYFAATNHPRSSVWLGFSNDQRTGAVAHAKRTLARYIGEALDTDTTTDDDFPRQDIAVYEQALWCLENSPILRDGREESPDAVASDPGQPDGARNVMPDGVAPEARKWLFRGGSLELGRG